MENNATATLGAGGVLILEKKILLVQINYGRAKGKWILPGGFLEKGEHPSQCVIREVKEETGLNVSSNGLLGVRFRKEEKEGLANVYWVFEIDLIGDHPAQPDLRWPREEIQEAKFWTLKDALGHPNVRPMTKKFIELAQNQARSLKRVQIPVENPFPDELFGKI